jgi:hypothetical protein
MPSMGDFTTVRYWENSTSWEKGVDLRIVFGSSVSSLQQVAKRVAERFTCRARDAYMPLPAIDMGEEDHS